MNKRENAMMAYAHQTPEWVPSRAQDFNTIFPAPFIERYQGKEKCPDGFGVEWQYESSIGAPMPTTGQILLDDVTRWKDVVKFPDLDLINWNEQAAADCAANEKDRLNVAVSINGLFERLHACMGMENSLCSLLTNPSDCYEFASAVADHKIRMVEKVAQYYDFDVFNMHDDYGTNDRLFMSPELWRECFKPLLKKVVDAVHAKGMIYQHHSCGFIEPIVPDLVEIGVDALDIWQVSNKNMRALKDQYQGVLTFCGGFDNQSVFDRADATYQEHYDETMRVLKLMAPGGSYIAFTITAKHFFLPAFNQAVMDFNRSVSGIRYDFGS